MNWLAFTVTYRRALVQAAGCAGCVLALYGMVVDRRRVDLSLAHKSARVQGDRVVLAGPELRRLLYQVGDSMGVPRARLQSVLLYINQGNLPLSVGFLPHRSPLGARLRSVPCIGLPLNFGFQFFDESKFSDINIDGKLLPIESDSSQGVEFRQQLMMTENAKLFVLARQLHYLDSNFMAVCATAKILSAFGVFQVLLYASSILSRVRPLTRYFYLGLIGTVSYLVQRELFRIYSNHVDLQADDAAAKLGTRYFHGGIEFYSKMIRMNKMLYAMGFTSRYTALGNERQGWLWSRGTSSYHAHINRMLHPSRKPRDPAAD